MDELIKIKTAKLAKEKGFNVICNAYYYLEQPKAGRLQPFGSISYDEEDGWYEYNHHRGCDVKIEFDSFVFAPTQTQLQKWLRDVHTIYVLMDNYNDINGNHIGWKYKIFKDNKLVDSMGGVSEYEHMLEYGLEKGLELIKL